MNRAHLPRQLLQRKIGPCRYDNAVASQPDAEPPLAHQLHLLVNAADAARAGAAQVTRGSEDAIQSINRQEIGYAGDAMRLTQDARGRRALLWIWSTGGSHFLIAANGERP